MFRKEILLALFLVPTMPAFAADLSGTWSTSGPVAPTCTFVQTGDALSGACKGANAEGPLTGMVDGQTAKWTYSWTAYADKNPGTFEFSGTVDGDTIKGTVLINGASRNFTANRQTGAAQTQSAQSAAASAPPAAAQPQINKAPPKTVWDIDLDGTAVHLMSGMVCGRMSGPFARTQVMMFDRIGFDVACNYFDQRHSEITIYLTRRDPAFLSADFEGAQKAVPQLTPDATPHDTGLASPAGFQWLHAGFEEKSRAAYSDLFYTSLSGWEYEIRATYPPDDAPAVTAAIADLSQRMAMSAGKHLADCAASPPPVRTGEAVGAGEQLLPLVLLGTLMAPGSIAEANNAVWCAEEGLASKSDAIVYWRNIAPGTKAPIDRITHIDMLPPLLVVEVTQGNGKLAGFDVAMDGPDKISLVGVFDGRPSLKALTAFLGPHGVYAEVDKSSKKVTIYANAVNPPSAGH